MGNLVLELLYVLEAWWFRRKRLHYATASEKGSVCFWLALKTDKHNSHSQTNILIKKVYLHKLMSDKVTEICFSLHL